MAERVNRGWVNPQEFLRDLDRQYGPFDPEQTPEELLHLLRSEGLLEDVHNVGLTSVRTFLARKLAIEG